MQRPNQTEQQPDSELVECINGILRVTKLREENYFRILDFVKKNLESIDKQMQQFTIINKFLMQVDQHESALLKQEEVLIVQHSSSAANCKKYPSAYRRLISRMSARLFELFENSLQQIQGTVFCTQKTEENFNYFKHSINRSLSAERVNFNMAVTIILKYSKSKYRAEVQKLRRFLAKIQSGTEIEFRRYYYGADEYDSDRSPDKQERDSSLKKKASQNRKNREGNRSKDKKEGNKFRGSSDKEESPRHSKPATVNKIMKLYNVLDPSKTQFLEDMVYNQSEEMHRVKLMNSLRQKNRAIEQQMRQYHKKVQFMADKIKERQAQLNSKAFSDGEGSDHHSGGEKGRSNYMKSQANIKANGLIISKLKKDSNNFMIRKSKRQLLQEQQIDFVINSAGQHSSGGEYASDTGAITDRNMGKDVRRPVSKSLLRTKPFRDLASRPTSRDEIRKDSQSQNSKQQIVSKGSTKNRIFIVKSPTLFEDESLHNRVVMNTGRIINKKAPQILKSARPTKRMSRSVLIKEQKIEKIEKIQKTQRTIQEGLITTKRSVFEEKIVLEEKHIFDPGRFRQLGEKKQFNLRLKKHTKKSVLASDKLFIEQTNDQINNYNF